MPDYHRVVVTGMGALTPIGNDLSTFWQSIISGKSGAAPISKFDASNLGTNFACELKNFLVDDFIDKKENRTMDRCSIYAIVSSMEAVSHSKLKLDEEDPYKVGVIWGTGIGGLESSSLFISEYALSTATTKKINPYFIPKMIANMAAGHLSIKFNAKGPNYATVSACASSNHAIMNAATAIIMGQAEVMITGGSEAPISEIGFNGFSVIKTLSKRNDSPTTASRPFDKNRDGFVMGEGSGALILESYDHAIKRGATIYAEVAGFASTSDAYHITAPDPDGRSVAKSMTLAMDFAKILPKEIDYINVHGTSTPLGDIAEIKGLEKALGDDLYNTNVSSTKSMTGHLLGAAGAIESIASIMAITENIAPPTINHFTPDDNFDKRINFTFNTAQRRIINTVINNSFGFGGHNTTIIFKKFIP